jgi:hypothetical protein
VEVIAAHDGDLMVEAIGHLSGSTDVDDAWGRLVPT